MSKPKMAELQFDAPLANFDSEEWNEFHDFQSVGDFENCNEMDSNCGTKRFDPAADTDWSSEDYNYGGGGGDVRSCSSSISTGGMHPLADASFNETFSGSLEDLVNNFDEQVTKCFRNFNEQVDEIAPVQLRTEDDILSDCQTWWTLTGQYGNLLPINWTKSYQAQTPSTEPELCYGDLDLYDEDDMDKEDEELFFTNDDLHEPGSPVSLHDPVISAEDVISEIEAMMEDSCIEKTLSNSSSTSHSNATSPDGTNRPPKWFEDGLERLPLNSLYQLYNELDNAVKECTQQMLQELTLNDDLKYEKELKNNFICLMISIQNKRREAKIDGDNNRTKRQMSGEGLYLTTVIPYRASEGYPTLQQLQIYVKILLAIDQDSSTVPGLLTDYILKVLCPTT